MWGRKRKTEQPDITPQQIEEALENSDVDEARQMRADASRELAVLRMQSGTVVRLTERLVERRRLNHFGDEIQITFTPRRSHG